MSVENSSNSSGGGNTKTPPNQSAAKKRWCLTLNNWTQKEYDDLIYFLSSNSSNKCIIGKEGDEKTPHLQIYINLNEKIRFTALKKINKRLHIEGCRGTEMENIKYCSKEGNFWTHNLKVPKPINCLMRENFYPFQESIVKKLEKEPNDREILWCVGNKNIGKTKLLKYICMKMDGSVLPISEKHALSQVHSTHEFTDIYCFNLTADQSEYQTHGFYSVMEAIKDELFASSFGVETNGMCMLATKHIIVVANKEPDWSKTEIDRDRFNIFHIKNNKLIKIIEESSDSEDE